MIFTKANSGTEFAEINPVSADKRIGFNTSVSGNLAAYFPEKVAIDFGWKSYVTSSSNLAST